jgi:hypothetical protein
MQFQLCLEENAEQESFELSVFKFVAQISQGIEKLSKALQVIISITIEKGQSSIALPTMEFDGLPVKDIESLRLLLFFVRFFFICVDLPPLFPSNPSQHKK